MSIATTPTTLVVIEALTKKYATARAVVSERVNALEDDVRDAHRRKVPGIKAALAVAKDAQAELIAAIEAAPELFVKPRTFTLNGIKVGYQKGKGKLTWDDDDKVVAKIRATYDEERADALIIKAEKPSKEALELLPANELKRLGVVALDAGDFVVVKATDSQVDKLVEKILKEGAVQETDAAE